MAQSHFQFVQSLEPLQGGGLGRAALALHTEFWHESVPSTLVATASEERLDAASRVFEFKRSGPKKAYWASGLGTFAARELAADSVVHGHGFYVGPNWVLGRLARKRAMPLVYHVHGIFEPWILQRSRLKKRIAHCLFENANFKHACLWRALHAKEADQIRAQGIAAPIVVAPNGLRLEEFDEVASVPRDDSSRRRILFLSRVHPKKGLDLLISAWSRLAAAHLDWELLIVGPDEGGYKATVEAMVRTAGLENSVVMQGEITGAAKVSLIKSAEIFILPSYSEGFSVAILEALACGIPVIATDACNFPELGAAGAGWECSPTVESVADALTKALSASNEERRQRGAAGRQLVEQRYSSKVIAQTILDACAQHAR